MMNNGLAILSVRFLRICRCTSAGPMDLWTFRFLRFSYLVSYNVWFFILPVPVFAFCNLDGEVGALVGENCGKKKIIDYLSLIHIPRNQASHFLPERTHIFHSLLSITSIPLEASLAAFVVPGQVLFYQGFIFPASPSPQLSHNKICIFWLLKASLLSLTIIIILLHKLLKFKRHCNSSWLKSHE